MSDFDKEAERQKLREKYERDKEKRKSTQRMSELLLKGATMTNRHCDECGDPIFRYDGQEFCPSCQNAQIAGGQEPGTEQANGQQTGGQQTGNQQAQAGGAEADDTAGTTSVKSGVDDATAEVGTGDESAEGVEAAVQTDDATGETESKPAVSTAPSTGASVSPRQPSAGQQSGDQQAAEQQPGEQQTSGEPQPNAGPTQRAAGSGDLADARASLQRSIVRFARQAENADDPRRARELLAASREAAEALAALNR